jgi:hypothetical protein
LANVKLLGWFLAHIVLLQKRRAESELLGKRVQRAIYLKTAKLPTEAGQISSFWERLGGYQAAGNAQRRSHFLAMDGQF